MDLLPDEVAWLQAERDKARAGLVEAEALIAKNVYPCPDKPHSPWGVLCRIRAALDALARPVGAATTPGTAEGSEHHA